LALIATNNFGVYSRVYLLHLVLLVFSEPIADVVREDIPALLNEEQGVRVMNEGVTREKRVPSGGGNGTTGGPVVSIRVNYLTVSPGE
jgi:hypothetical protein